MWTEQCKVNIKRISAILHLFLFDREFFSISKMFVFIWNVVYDWNKPTKLEFKQKFYFHRMKMVWRMWLFCGLLINIIKSDTAWLQPISFIYNNFGMGFLPISMDSHASLHGFEIIFWPSRTITQCIWPFVSIYFVILMRPHNTNNILGEHRRQKVKKKTIKIITVNRNNEKWTEHWPTMEMANVCYLFFPIECGNKTE